jgi:hypothetical protein
MRGNSPEENKEIVLSSMQYTRVEMDLLHGGQAKTHTNNELDNHNVGA